MKKKIFEKFQAKSLGKESQKSIVGGTWYECVNLCMNAAFDYWNENCDDGGNCHNWTPSTYMYTICQPDCSADPDRTSWNIEVCRYEC